MSKKETTIDSLARMVAEGFENTADKGDIQRIEKRLDRIENVLIRKHDNYIEELRDRVRVLETKLGVS